MNIKTLKECLKICRRANITAAIWGHRGCGKSAIIRELAEEGDGNTIIRNGSELRLPIGFVDFRGSQIERSELRGLPDRVNNRTTYCTPEELPIGDLTAEEIYDELASIDDQEKRRVRKQQLQPHYQKGILALEELNRSEDDVLQASFQLIWDKQIGQYVLPSGWSIVIACNYMDGDYLTNNFNDPAFLDRMCHLQLTAGEQTFEEWTGYMSRHHGSASADIIEFCGSNMDYLVGKVNGNLGFSIQPSPRSWDLVAQASKAAKQGNHSIEARNLVIAGLVGQECMLAFTTYECPVRPRDVLRDGVKAHADKLVKLSRNQLLGVSWGLISLVRGNQTAESPGICFDLAELLLASDETRDKDVVVAFCRALVGGEEQQPAIVACITNIQLAESMLTFIGPTNPYLTELCRRKEFHKELSTIGWGKSDGRA